MVDTGLGQRSAGTGLLLGGAVVGAVGAALSGVGCGFGCAVTPGNPGKSIPEAQLEAARTGKTLMTVGFIGVGVGAGVAVIGAVVLATAPSAPVQSVSIVPVAGGGVVQIGGRF